MATAVDAALAEIDTTLAAIAPAHEGLRDFASLNLSREAQVDVRASLVQYDRRVLALKAARAGLVALVADGYPELVPREVSPAVLRDLADNAATIEAALHQFGSNAATALHLADGPTEAK